MAAEKEIDDEEHKHLNNMRVVLERDMPDWTDPLLTGFPCGILRCTYEKHPKAIYANDWMFHFMGVQEDSEDWKEFIQQNVFFMVPFEEREVFKRDLQRATESGKAVPIEHRIRNCSGGKTCLTGWVRVAQTDVGIQEYVFLYMPISETCFSFWEEREAAYETALKAVYDVIFRIEWRTRVLECIYTRSEAGLLDLKGLQVILNTAIEERLVSLACEEDHAEAEQFFSSRYEGRRTGTYKKWISFRLSKELTAQETGVIGVDLDDRTTLFCCRELTRDVCDRPLTEQSEPLQGADPGMDGNQKKQSAKTVVYRLSRGLVYLEYGDDGIGESGVPLPEFLQRYEVAEGEYWTAVRDGKTYLEAKDPQTGGKRVLYGVRRTGTAEKHEEFLLFLYIFKPDDAADLHARPRVTISTFGYFDVLVDGKPIIFRNQKSKEMLAVLVDRKGSFVSNPYFISCLWGDEPYSEKIRSRCRQTAFRMMKTLEQYGIDYIVEKVDGHRRIVPELVDCDYFNYINEGETAGRTFNGAYMSDYSWGEETLSCLMKGEVHSMGHETE